MIAFAEPARWPMQYLVTHGPRADPATTLLWALIWLSVAVVVIVTVLVTAGVIVRRRRAPSASMAPPSEEGGDGRAWFGVGLGLTVVALLAAMVWTVRVLAAVDSPRGRPRVTVEVTGHQWWWEIRYLASSPTAEFTTSGEIHIPAGEPVLVKLVSADVVHSFWIPTLSGKTDAIPGQVNLSWLQADKPGIYHGQCAEYCGLQHSHMALDVVAEPAAAFATWRAAQLVPAATPVDATALAGEAMFTDRCGACHTVRGSNAGGVLGPDLTHLMSRSTLASGALPNTVGDLSGWIADPQSAKPGVKMPPTFLSGGELKAVVAYLEGLK